MNDITNAEDVRKSERERMAKVFASELAKGKETTAQALLTKTELPRTRFWKSCKPCQTPKKTLLKKRWRL